MLTITKTYTVYNFNELSEDAKEAAKEKYLMETDFRNDDFYSYKIEALENNFPHSRLNLQYSLAYSQGDGANIYGELDLKDLFPFITEQCKKGLYTAKEVKRLKFYAKQVRTFELKRNTHYCYSLKRQQFDDDSIEWNLEMDGIRDIDKQLIKRFRVDFLNYFASLDSDIARDGYDYLYYISDYEFREIADWNEWIFNADGTIFDK